jgi:hypothetical protein
LHAGFAADAALVIEVDDTVVAPEQGDSRADFDARRIVAVVAAQHRKMAPGIRVHALFDVFDPGPIHPQRDVVFFFASHRAGMTADAAMLIDEKSVTHFIPFESKQLTIHV